MSELEKIVKEIGEKLKISFRFYKENSRPTNVPICDKQFEGTTDDGKYTYFRFLYRNVGYIGVLDGATEIEKNYAVLLPAYLEAFAEKETDLSKAEYLKRILLGESSSMGIYKYMTKYSVRGAACFVLVLRVPKLMQETLAVLAVGSAITSPTSLKMVSSSVSAFIAAATF